MRSLAILSGCQPDMSFPIPWRCLVSCTPIHCLASRMTCCWPHPLALGASPDGHARGWEFNERVPHLVNKSGILPLGAPPQTEELALPLWVNVALQHLPQTHFLLIHLQS